MIGESIFCIKSPSLFLLYKPHSIYYKGQESVLSQISCVDVLYLRQWKKRIFYHFKRCSHARFEYSNNSCFNMQSILCEKCDKNYTVHGHTKNCKVFNFTALRIWWKFESATCVIRGLTVIRQVINIYSMLTDFI